MKPIISNIDNDKLKFVDLFCGIGGFRIAFNDQGCECVFSCDIDKNVQATYFDNFNEMPRGDITKIDKKDIPLHDILCAGFPCQSFSIAGKRLGFEDTRGTLFFEVAKIIKEKQPKAVFLENVKGLTNHDNGRTLQVILDTLTSLGYDYIYKILNAKDYNIPQNRERWYCVCFRKDLKVDTNNFHFPEKQLLKTSIKDFLENSFDDKYTISSSCQQNIEKFINLKNIKVENTTLAYEIRASRCQFKTDGIAPCLTAKMGTGGNNVPILVQKNRKLTERECLNLMGFPKWYNIRTGSNIYKQIGNSVVVPIIEEIAKEIIEILKKEDLK